MDPMVETELRAAIEGLYVAFAGYPLRDWTEPCLDCCTTVDIEAELHSAPLRELSADVMGEYGLHVMTTWGDEREFKHLLPRLFELLVTTGFSFRGDPDAAWILPALPAARWWTWPEAEREAVECFLEALWDAVLATDGELNCWVGPAIEVLEEIAGAVDDLSPFLARLGPGQTPSADHHFLHMAHLVLDPSTSIGNWGTWSKRPVQLAQLRSWYRSDDQKARSTAFLNDPDPTIRQDAARYLALLGRPQP